MQDKAAIRSRLYTLTHLQMEALARKLNGGTVGCSPLTKWKHGTPENPGNRQIRLMLADWMLDRYSLADIDNALPEFEGQRQRSTSQRHTSATTTPARPPAAPAATPAPATPVPANTPTVVRGAPPPATNTPAAQPTPAAPATPAPSQYQPGSLEYAIETICRDTIAKHPAASSAPIDMASVIDTVFPLIEAAVERAKLPRVTTIRVVTPATPEGVDMGRQHMTFPRLLSRCALQDASGSRMNVWLSGPAGSGKTSGAKAVAKALNLPFYAYGSIDTEYKLLGFTDAQGRVVCTAFRKAWTEGGVIILDECDGSFAVAILALNAALANGLCAFPDGTFPRHKDCIIIATANTWGTGATFEYVGRTKLDAASMDRFIRMTWDYDDALVRDTCGNPAWADKVVSFRRRAASIKGHIISPRAAYIGSVMLAAGIPEAEVIEELITPGLSPDQCRTVMGA